MEDNHIYQYSLVNALMDGVSESGITVSKLKQKGNQGLGTFTRMNGELIFLDGVVYQLQAEGNIQIPNDNDQVPFAVSTNFVPEQTREVQFKNKEDVEKCLNGFNDHAANLFITYRIKGHFEYIKSRTVRGQQYKGEPLAELSKRQSEEEYEGVDATIIGFRYFRICFAHQCPWSLVSLLTLFQESKELARLQRSRRASPFHHKRPQSRWPRSRAGGAES